MAAALDVADVINAFVTANSICPIKSSSLYSITTGRCPCPMRTVPSVAKIVVHLHNNVTRPSCALFDTVIATVIASLIRAVTALAITLGVGVLMRVGCEVA